METRKVDEMMMELQSKLPPEAIATVREKLLLSDENKAAEVMGAIKNPVLILVTAWFMIDRFFLGQAGLGVFKIITCGGCNVWWIIDMFTAFKRTKDYNLKKVLEILG